MNLFRIIADFFSDLCHWAFERQRTGGFVPPQGEDSVPAILTNGWYCWTCRCGAENHGEQPMVTACRSCGLEINWGAK